MIRYLIAMPLMMHGLAHVSGFLGSWTNASVGFSERPWLLSSNITLHSPIGRAFGALWLIAAVALVGVGVGLLAHQVWWLPLAPASAAVSLFVIVPWWNTVPPGAKLGAVFDLLVILVLLSPWRNSLLEAVR